MTCLCVPQRRLFSSVGFDAFVRRHLVMSHQTLQINIGRIVFRMLKRPAQLCVEIRQFEMFDEPLDVFFVDVLIDLRRSEAMTSGIVEACPRSLIFASPVVRVIQNEY